MWYKRCYAGTLQAEPVFPHSPPSSMFFFSVGQFRSKILALPGFGNFSVEHARSFYDNAKIFQPIKFTLNWL